MEWTGGAIKGFSLNERKRKEHGNKSGKECIKFFFGVHRELREKIKSDTTEVEGNKETTPTRTCMGMFGGRKREEGRKGKRRNYNRGTKK